MKKRLLIVGMTIATVMVTASPALACWPKSW